MRAGAPPPRQHLATRALVLGTPPQPAPDVFHTRPSAPVRANCREDDQGGAFFDPFNGGQVATGQAIEGGTSIEAGFVALLVAMGLGRQGLPITGVGKG